MSRERGTDEKAGRLRRTLSGLPLGLERVLVVAVAEPEFREELLAGRDEAARRRGLLLTASEGAMLRAIPAVQLETTIAGLDTSAANLRRRSFLRTVAAGALTLAAAEALGGCGTDEASMGIRPGDGSPDTRRPDFGEDEAGSRGIRPDMPPPLDAGAPDNAAPDLGSSKPELGSFGVRPG